MDKAEALNVQQACMEFGRMNQDGQLTQDQLDYEMAQITLAMLADYGPQPWSLPKPFEMRTYESLSEDDFKDMNAQKSAELYENYKKAKKQWLQAQDSIRYQNASNFEWLKKVSEVLNKFGKQTFDVDNLIAVHERKGWSNQ